MGSNIALDDLLRRLTCWRSSNKPPTPIPEQLWSEAVVLAQEYGVSQVARMLKVGHQTLQRKMGGTAPLRAVERETQTAELVASSFMELFPPVPTLIGELNLELQFPKGILMKLEMRKVPADCVAGLLRELAR